MALMMGSAITLKATTDCINIPKLIKSGFVIFGIVMVCFGFYKTMIRASQRSILIREEVIIEDKHTYPSITFCNKYKYGGKNVFRNYYPYLYQHLRNSGRLVRLIFHRRL